MHHSGIFPIICEVGLTFIYFSPTRVPFANLFKVLLKSASAIVTGISSKMSGAVLTLCSSGVPNTYIISINFLNDGMVFLCEMLPHPGSLPCSCLCKRPRLPLRLFSLVPGYSARILLVYDLAFSSGNSTLHCFLINFFSTMPRTRSHEVLIWSDSEEELRFKVLGSNLGKELRTKDLVAKILGLDFGIDQFRFKRFGFSNWGRTEESKRGNGETQKTVETKMRN